MKRPSIADEKQKEDVPYQIEAVARACRILRILQGQQNLPLFELSEMVGLSRPTVFRLLATLQANGIVVKDDARRYRLAGGLMQGQNYRIGYIAETSADSFYRAVSRGLVESAAQAGIDLIALDSHNSPEIALANAKRLLAEKIDLAIEFHAYGQVASVISARGNRRTVPLIAVEIPHPNAIYFGVDNCQAGLVAGRYLARWAEQNFNGQTDEILLIGATRAGALPQARLTGSLLGIHQVLPDSANARITMIDGDWRRDMSHDAVKSYLKTSTASRILVSAINDPSAIGALEAFKDAGRLHNCAIVGQNGSIEARLEMHHASSRLIGSVAYFPERYGEQLIRLVVELLSQRNPAPRAVFIKHLLLTPANLKQHYGRELQAASLTGEGW
ncbi:putative sugar uptake ABC transporter periplasmic solute-binding protein precursor [Acidisarcina polymorpha]|uniref:Putative sugar uptake ABC transporter periplasmic solute-binding protein n=1 Tax=Acidisarcina polymorpha TaxID=2211140 RepID=A0A2Z5G2R7_9BACT|nr:substrate-binding domain-containing protein [Acidisarcina polymorpha]AXC12826.1 putative sugar uptake ABC transporter periplasmic solute-binding protein precursor [Acidisarcina polymorpha]